MPIADPHCHTLASDGMATPAELVDAAVAMGVNLIAITDHDTMANAAEVVERGTAAGIAVVPGQEVTTKWPAMTHIIGWFLEKPIPRSMTVLDTVKAIHEQGGLVVIPHPFMPTYFASMQPDVLLRLIDREPGHGPRHHRLRGRLPDGSAGAHDNSTPREGEGRSARGARTAAAVALAGRPAYQAASRRDLAVEARVLEPQAEHRLQVVRRELLERDHRLRALDALELREPLGHDLSQLVVLSHSHDGHEVPLAGDCVHLGDSGDVCQPWAEIRERAP